MKIQCSYCGQMISDTEQSCPYCGAANTQMRRAANGVPTTIQELKDYCITHNLPLKEMRVFIGEDYRGARAFGIYQDEVSGNFIVYKNKADGSRAVRYEGKDEPYAVNELYLKIRERVIEQKKHQVPTSYTAGSRSVNFPKTSKRFRFPFTFYLTIFIAILMSVVTLYGDLHRPQTGYYSYQNSTYYYYQSNWYKWNDYSDSWSITYVDDSLQDNHEDYYQSRDWNDSYEADEFTSSSSYSSGSDNYLDNNDWDDDWDDDYDWDDSWDDWDSDW